MSQKKQDKPKVPKVGWLTQITVAVLIFTVISLAYSITTRILRPVQEIPLSEVATLITQGSVQSLVVSGDILEITTTEDVKKKSQKEAGTPLTETLTYYGVTPESLATASIEIKSESGIGYWLMNILPVALPMIFMIIFIWFLFAQMRGGGMGGGKGPFSFGQSKARITHPDDEGKKVTFASVAGNEEAKQELIEVVDFLKHPQKYLTIGAKIPKGILLTGDPGTGKTLLARAVAGEAGVPFFHLSGSEFVEMFVGVGASRVRDLFDQAKTAAPAIIFIDEIDAVGRSRGVGIGGGNDEREQTLNQILVEMDGFEPTEKVVVMAATNRADVLDTALLRPGRFDRRVYLTLPDRKDRELILKIHAHEKPLDAHVNLTVVAERTPGFSGADLESLMNEAAILAARQDRTTVTQSDILASIEKVMMGPERKSHLHTKKDREIVAYHEAGHAILSSALEFADPVHKITIIPRGGAGGYTMSLPLEEHMLTSHKEYLDDLAMLLGGRAAEKLIFGDITGGAQGDIATATKTARAMITQWGMSELLGPVAYHEKEHSTTKDYSDETAKKIDEEVASIIKQALARAEAVLATHKDALVAVAQKLLEVETLEQEEYHELIKPFGLIGKVNTTPAA